MTNWEYATKSLGLTFSNPHQQSTVNGLHYVMEATPTAAFWAAWKENREDLKSKGISLSKSQDGKWIATFWSKVTSK